MKGTPEISILIENDHQHQSYMLDTNVFNHLLAGKISIESLAGQHLIVLAIQADELAKTPDSDLKANLLKMIEIVSPETIPASSFAFDIEGAGFNQAYWNDGTGTFEKMRERLRELDATNKLKIKKNKSKSNEEVFLNQERDILIAEATIQNNATLVSADKNLLQVVIEFGGQAIDSTIFCSEPFNG